jgi:hypothetical protein
LPNLANFVSLMRYTRREGSKGLYRFKQRKRDCPAKAQNQPKMAKIGQLYAKVPFWVVDLCFLSSFLMMRAASERSARHHPSVRP